MIILVSPTKQMDSSSPLPEIRDMSERSLDRALFPKETDRLINHLKGMSPEELAGIMKTSSALAEATYRNIRNFNNSKHPALFSYSGTVFKALDACSLNNDDLDFAGRHLRILSGLYGMLRPFDMISPYRLEMKTPLNLPGESSLTGFWKKRVTGALQTEERCDVIINLASAEYLKVIDKKQMNRQIITPEFKENEEHRLRTVGMYAKTARGKMIRRIIREKITDPEKLKKGRTAGYQFKAGLSSDTNWVFIRNHL